MPSIHIKVQPFKFCFILLCIAGSLVGISTALWYFPTRFKWKIDILFELFYIDREKNIPTLYSVLLLSLCAILIFIIAFHRRGKPSSYFPHWLGLAFGFSLMACDEFMMLHELFVRPMNKVLGEDRSAFLNFSWVVPGIIVVTLLAVVYIRFLMKLPSRTRWLFIVAAILYLGGVIGMEILGGYIQKVYGDLQREYIIACHLEESLEYSGTVLFIYSLLDFIKQQAESIRFSFSSGSPVVPPLTDLSVEE